MQCASVGNDSGDRGEDSDIELVSLGGDDGRPQANAEEGVREKGKQSRRQVRWRRPPDRLIEICD